MQCNSKTVSRNVPNAARRPAPAPRAAKAAPEAPPSVVTPFAPVKSEQEFFGVMGALVEAGKFPKHLMPLWQDFYNNYKTAVVGSGQNDETFVAEVQAAIADRVVGQFMAPYEFPAFHTRLTEPYDYYAFGQKYVGGLIDFNTSFLGNRANFDQMAAQIAAGENVIVFANHQTEADPAVWAHMLEAAQPQLATDVIYVAGDRVVSDPMCKPFSMGRNLLCVHSKKHMFDDPDTVDAKQRQNRKTLVTMARLLNEGGKLIWIAPSGGRDRPAEVDGKDVWVPDNFDPSAVGLMMKMAESAKKPTHLYPMAMVSWAVMPPPKQKEKDLGERRLTNYSGVGISAGNELDIAAMVKGVAEGVEPEEVVAKAVHAQVVDEYRVLESMVYDEAFRTSSAEKERFVQPWKKNGAGEKRKKFLGLF